MQEKLNEVAKKETAKEYIALIHDGMCHLPRAKRQRLDNVMFFVSIRFFFICSCHTTYIVPSIICVFVQVFWQAHGAFVVVRSRATDGRASMEMTVVIVEKLYVVLAMVSSGCSTPLPLGTKYTNKLVVPFTFTIFPLEHGLEGSG